MARRPLFSALIMSSAMLAASSCGGDVRSDDLRSPMRIVSLSPTATEILYAIGAGDDVTAVDEMSTFPTEAPRRELSRFHPEADAIAALNPTLVVVATDATDADGVTISSRLKDRKIAALVQGAPAKLDDVYQQIKDLGDATRHVDQATNLINSMKEDIASTVSKAPKRTNPVQYFHEIDTGYYTATSRTFIGSVYALFGLANIADPLDQKDTGYVKISDQDIVTANPDVIFLADTRCCAQRAATVTDRPGWKNITAVKQRKIIELDDDIASRWGPRIVTFVSTIAAAIS